MLVVNFLPRIITYLLNLGQNVIDSSPGILWFFIPIASLVSAVLSNYVAFGANQVYLRLIGGENATLKDLLTPARLFVNYIIATIIMSFVVLIGFLLLIVPGIILSIKFQFYAFLIIDKKLGAIDALKMSSRIADGIKMDLFIFGFILSLVNLGGLLLLGVGALATLPITTFASVYVYRKLLAQTETNITPIVT